MLLSYPESQGSGEKKIVSGVVDDYQKVIFRHNRKLNMEFMVFVTACTTLSKQKSDKIPE